MTGEWTVTCRVNKGWRILHEGKVHSEGALLDLPVIQACEWHAWGSVAALGPSEGYAQKLKARSKAKTT